MFSPFFALADYIVYELSRLDPKPWRRSSILVAIIRSWFPPERTKRILAHT